MKRIALLICMLALPLAAEGMPPVVDAAGLKRLLKKNTGHPILVNVLASWCEPCRAELPDLAVLKKKFPSLVLIGLDIDAEEPALEKFLPELPPELVMVRNPAGFKAVKSAIHFPADWNRAMPPGWEENVPLSFLFDKRGRFINGSVGQLSQEALDSFAQVLR
jgi:thiol-disulfide isomerase/thioredoxin